MGERYLGGNDLISRHYRNITTLISHAMKQEITQKENKSKADLFVSVHCNSFSSAVANGVEVLYYPTSAKGQKAAQCVQDSLVRATKLTNRGIKSPEKICTS